MSSSEAAEKDLRCKAGKEQLSAIRGQVSVPHPCLILRPDGFSWPVWGGREG